MSWYTYKAINNYRTDNITNFAEYMFPLNVCPNIDIIYFVTLDFQKDVKAKNYLTQSKKPFSTD